MERIGPSFFILGLFVASAFQPPPTTQSVFNTQQEIQHGQFNDNMNPPTTMPTSTADAVTNTTMTLNATASTIQSTNTSVKAVSTPRPPRTSLRPPVTSEATTPTSKSVSPHSQTPSTSFKEDVRKGDTTSIVTIVIILTVVVLVGVIFYFLHRRRRRDTLDFTSRLDEVAIPLSTVEPDVPVDSEAQNGMQNVGSAGAGATSSWATAQEPETKPEGEDEQRADPENSDVADGAVSAPSPDGAPDDAIDQSDELSPAAPVEPSPEEQTDDDSTLSNNTSEETLKEPNDNNSNNADVKLNTARDLTSSSIFSEVPLSSP
ncbi:uncharacterized protein LOC142996852 isoform X2 [Genypterus blacodes]|uniref:uncharacterized protein LOC142996852 isoform X2 n=1 Tax=Genypterus blacodes TaxID=154954 RepID=UPI003F76EC3C